MTLAEARHTFEHGLLPAWVYADGVRFLTKLIDKDENAPYELMKSVCEKNGVEMSYSPESYKLRMLNISEKLKILILDMPKPKREHECRRVYFVFDMDFYSTSYLMSEMTANDEDDLAGYDEEGTYYNYGPLPSDENMAVPRIIAVHAKRDKKVTS